MRHHSQDRHVMHWATLAIPELVRGIATLVQDPPYGVRMPLERIRWVPCHYQAYSDDVDVVIQRDEGRVSVRGGFRRTRLHETGIPSWKWDKFASTNDYAGPWNVTEEVVTGTSQ